MIPPGVIGAIADQPQGGGPGGSVMYMATADGNLHTVDVATGVITLVGYMGNAPYSGEWMRDIAFDPTTGILYGMGATYTSGVNIYTINTADATLTQVGNTGFGCPGASIVSDPSGQFYHAEGYQCSGGRYNSMNKANGSLSYIANLSYMQTGGLACDSAGNAYMAVFPSGADIRPITLATGALGAGFGATQYLYRSLTFHDGELYGARNSGSAPSGQFVHINISTGAETIIGPVTNCIAIASIG